MGAKRGSKPWNWRGEPVVDPRGYVLIFVGKDHPLADVRGYAYQHRLVATETLGRLPLPGEEIHHANESKGDNSPGNLEALTTLEHRARHRHPGSNLRPVGTPNVEIFCECGCGQSFEKYDKAGRPRKYVSGHNTNLNRDPATGRNMRTGNKNG